MALLALSGMGAAALDVTEGDPTTEPEFIQNARVVTKSFIRCTITVRVFSQNLLSLTSFQSLE